MAKYISYISMMSELGAGTRGASLGFDALRMASYDIDRKFFDRYKISRIKDFNEFLFMDYTDESAKRIDSISLTFKYIDEEIGSELKKGAFPVVFSGDHSNAAGTIWAIKNAYPESRLGVVWIDAHADLHSPYTSPSGNVHGMPLAISIGEDNLEKKINDPHPETIGIWNAMKGPEPRINPSDIFFISVRDTEEPEEHLMKKYYIPNVKTAGVRRLGPVEVAKRALKHLDDCDIIYVSFDVDSLDPSISSGTGTPVPEGLTVEEARDIILTLLDSKKICCLETTEINPLLCDKGNAMAEAAFEVIKPVIEKIEQNFEK